MTWVEPKINWDGNPEEHFNIEPDYIRIKNNIEFLHELGCKLYLNFNINEMRDVKLGDVLTVSSFNTVSDNVDTVIQNTFIPQGYTKVKPRTGNGVVWSFTELNTLENNLLELNDILQLQKNARKRLSFRLGGGKI
jgi:hypothetical protein